MADISKSCLGKDYTLPIPILELLNETLIALIAAENLGSRQKASPQVERNLI
jgi:hypothetical protein